MTDAPRASIVINNYNYGRFVADSIESALAQTYRNTEVVVVDDGSTDNSIDVIQSYDDRVSGVFKPNGGQGSAYNAGFRLARGEIVCFLDSDDTLDPDAMETVIAVMQDRRVVKAQWPLRVVDVDGQWHGQLSTKQAPPDGDLRQRVISDGPLYDFEFTTGAAYRRDFLRCVLPMPEEPYRNGGDVYLITLAPVFGFVRTAPKALGTYRVHGANNFRDKPLDEQRVRNYLQRFESNCSVLERELIRQGEQADINRWKARNFNYTWPTRFLQATSDIESLILPGESFVLVNNNEWGNGRAIRGRTAIPFLERDGEYWGPPGDDQTAIAELFRMRQQNGAAYVVFAWTAYWWFDCYPTFHAYLRSKMKCVLENDRLIVFDIRGMELERAYSKN